MDVIRHAFTLGIRILFFLLTSAVAVGQAAADTDEVRYVAALNGLIVRSQPDAASSRSGKLVFNEAVHLGRRAVRDTIDFRDDYWYAIESPGTGYIFGGYLNHIPLIDTFSLYFEYYLKEYLRHFSPLDTIEYSQLDNLFDEKDGGTLRLIRGQGITYLYGSGYETSRTTFYFEKVGINELANIFDFVRAKSAEEVSYALPDRTLYGTRGFRFRDVNSQDWNSVQVIDAGVVRVDVYFSL